MPGIIDLTNRKILVVEDDDMNYIYLSQIFKLIKGELSRAKTGSSAVSLAKSNKFDIILMDLQLPDINGSEVTKQIREFDKDTPIIVQTASRNTDETDAALDSGCTDILVKPYTMNDLTKILDKFLRPVI
jgi:DNA-binding response OmpR family regulator